MKWRTSKRQVQVFCAVAALAMTCGAAMAASDTEQFATIQGPQSVGRTSG